MTHPATPPGTHPVGAPVTPPGVPEFHTPLQLIGGVRLSSSAFGDDTPSGIGREMGIAGFIEYLKTKLIAEAG